MIGSELRRSSGDHDPALFPDRMPVPRPAECQSEHVEHAVLIDMKLNHLVPLEEAGKTRAQGAEMQPEGRKPSFEATIIDVEEPLAVLGDVPVTMESIGEIAEIILGGELLFVTFDTMKEGQLR